MEGTALEPAEVVREWLDAFNVGNADELVEFYHENAVNHQTTQDPVEGREEIRQMFEREFSATEMDSIPEVIHEAGDVAILEWKEPIVLRGCDFIRSGMAKSYFRGAIGISFHF